MAIDKDRVAKVRVRLRDQTGKFRMEWEIQRVDPVQNRAQRQAAVIDFFAISNNPRHGSKPAGHANGLRIGMRGQGFLDELGIELIGFAIEI